MIATDWLRWTREIWDYRKLILKVCAIGAAIGLIIGFSTPKEYTAKIFIAPESTRRSSSSGIDALAAMTDVNPSPSTERDAIYPSLYPQIINSTPFLVQLFDIKVHQQKDSTTITLTEYLKKYQKRPWWNTIKSASYKLLSQAIGLFKGKLEIEEIKNKSDSNSKISLFQLTREEVGIAGAIASRIHVGVDKEKRTITLYVTMQDPVVAATVADTVSTHLRRYITDYRTSKARRILKYNEALCKEAQVVYYDSQKKYTQYADANRDLARHASHAELTRLRNEMNLAYTTYNQMELQVQAAQAKVERVTPVYAVIQPVVIPFTHSKPRKMLILTGCILLGVAGSIGWIIFMKDYIKKIRKRIMMPAGK